MHYVFLYTDAFKAQKKKTKLYVIQFEYYIFIIFITSTKR